jgi:serine/threonine protein kinase/tetratricopeptide (TPR) repeat protein
MTGNDLEARNGSGADPSTDGELALALEAYLSAVERGEAIDPRRLAAEHPAIADELRSCLEVLRLAGRVEGEPVDEAAAGEIEDPAPTSTLGDFRILRQVGRGGMGVVYEAEQVSLHRRVALKVLPFASALDPLQSRRFQTEAQAAAQLHHTNIVPVFSVGCERGVHYYAMQFIEGQTLAALIQDLRRLSGLESAPAEATTTGPSLAEEVVSGRLAPAPPRADQGSPHAAPTASERLQVRQPTPLTSSHNSTRNRAYFRTVANLGMQAAEALEHAHSLGVIHRDIKPANLLVDVRGNLWITDFGLARMQSDTGLTMTGDVIGTLRYMSPEQAMAKRAIVDHRADIYSLGVTLYELLTLRPAFGGQDREELLRQVTLEEPRSPRRLNPSVPIDLETIVLKAMAKEPVERYATARELADDLRRFLEMKPIQARRPTLRDRTLKLARRHAGLVAASLLVLLLATGGLVTSLILIGREHAATKAALARAIAQEQLARHNAEEAIAQASRANQSFGWFLGGITEPLKRMANPDLARNPDYAEMRREVVAEAVLACDGFLRTQIENPGKHADTIATWIHIALLYTVANDHAKACDAYREAIEVAERGKEEEPRFASWYLIGQAHSHLGMELWDLGKTAESTPHFRTASDAFRRAVELAPTSMGVLQSSAWYLCLFQDPRYRDPPRALELARRLVALTSEREHNRRSFAGGIRPLFTLGLAEYRVGHWGAARKALERSKELRDGGDAYEGFVLSMVLARQGDVGRARTLYRDAVQWMKKYRYGDFELHALDAEASALLGSLAAPTHPIR